MNIRSHSQSARNHSLVSRTQAQRLWSLCSHFVLSTSQNRRFRLREWAHSLLLDELYRLVPLVAPRTDVQPVCPQHRPRIPATQAQDTRTQTKRLWTLSSHFVLSTFQYRRFRIREWAYSLLLDELYRLVPLVAPGIEVKTVLGRSKRFNDFPPPCA